MIEHVADRVFQKLLGQLHVVFELVKSHLRLDHPELGQMARRVAVLGAKGWAEGVNLGKRQCEDFPFELAADGEKSRLAEKILLPVETRKRGRESFLDSADKPPKREISG